jgi:hypothetical protein
MRSVLHVLQSAPAAVRESQSMLKARQSMTPACAPPARSGPTLQTRCRGGGLHGKPAVPARPTASSTPAQPAAASPGRHRSCFGEGQLDGLAAKRADQSRIEPVAKARQDALGALSQSLAERNAAVLSEFAGGLTDWARHIMDCVVNRTGDDVPETVSKSGTARAYYGCFKEVLSRLDGGEEQRSGECSPGSAEPYAARRRRLRVRARARSSRRRSV